MLNYSPHESRSALYQAILYITMLCYTAVLALSLFHARAIALIQLP